MYFQWGGFQKDKPKLDICVSRILKIGLQFEFFVQTVAAGEAYLDLLLVIKTVLKYSFVIENVIFKKLISLT